MVALRTEVMRHENLCAELIEALKHSSPCKMRLPVGMTNNAGLNTAFHIKEIDVPGHDCSKGTLACSVVTRGQGHSHARSAVRH